MKRSTMSLFVVVLLLFALTLSSCATIDKRKTVSVSGSGTVNLVPDMVNFSVGISETAETTGEAQQKANAKISAILAILRVAGIEEKDIATSSLSISTDYTWENGYQERVCERVSQNVRVKMKDITGFGALVDKIGSSVSGLSFNNVSFDVEDRTPALIKARELAYQDAYTKAQTYATSSRLTISSPITISEGYSSYNTRNYSMKSAVAMTASVEDSFATDAPTGELSLEVSVDITFELK